MLVQYTADKKKLLNLQEKKRYPWKSLNKNLKKIKLLLMTASAEGNFIQINTGIILSNKWPQTIFST